AAFGAFLRSLYRQSLGRVRQAALREPRPRAALPGAVHPPCRDLEPPARRRDRRHRILSLERLSTRQSDPHAHPRGRRVSPTLSPPRPAEALRPHPLLRPAGAPVPHPRSGDLSLGLGAHLATTCPHTVSGRHADSLVAVPSLRRAHAQRRTANAASALPCAPPHRHRR